MRSDPRYLAVIPHHKGDDNNLPTLVQQPRLSFLSLAVSLEALCFSSSLSISLTIISLVASISMCFSSLFAFAASSLSFQSCFHGDLSTLRLSLTRKFTDPISTKLHCVSYLHAVASIYSVRNCTLPSPFSFTSRCNRYFTSTCAQIRRGGASPSAPIHLAEKNLPFRPSLFVSPLE